MTNYKLFLLSYELLSTPVGCDITKNFNSVHGHNNKAEINFFWPLIKMAKSSFTTISYAFDPVIWVGASLDIISKTNDDTLQCILGYNVLQ